MNRLWIIFIYAIISYGYCDLVQLKNGRILEGKVTHKPDSIVLEIPTGRMEIPKSIILKITKSKTVMEILEQRKSSLTEDDASGWFDLYLWASKNKFSREDLLILLDKVIIADPTHEAAKEKIFDILIDEEEILVEEEPEPEVVEEIEEVEEVVQEEDIQNELELERKIKEEYQFGLLPIEIQYNLKNLIEFEDFIDELYHKQHFFPTVKFANRGGLNLLFNFIFFRAKKVGFSEIEARDIANKYKNIASVGGDRAIDAFQRTFATIRRLDVQRNPKKPRSGTNRFQDVNNKPFFLFLVRFSAKVASGGRRADGEFNSAYSFLFFKFYNRNFMGLPEYVSYRLATKCAAIVAAGGGDDRFRRAFGFHLRQFRDVNRNMREAVPYAIKEALLETFHPRRFFLKKNK